MVSPLARLANRGRLPAPVELAVDFRLLLLLRALVGSRGCDRPGDYDGLDCGAQPGIASAFVPRKLRSKISAFVPVVLALEGGVQGVPSVVFLPPGIAGASWASRYEARPSPGFIIGRFAGLTTRGERCCVPSPRIRRMAIKHTATSLTTSPGRAALCRRPPTPWRGEVACCWRQHPIEGVCRSWLLVLLR
jgi:hypothetical protein